MQVLEIADLNFWTLLVMLGRLTCCREWDLYLIKGFAVTNYGLKRLLMTNGTQV
ncbi:MAG: hypothetical protein U1E78_02420 [Gammaproteobacteria bacterium]